MNFHSQTIYLFIIIISYYHIPDETVKSQVIGLGLFSFLDYDLDKL